MSGSVLVYGATGFTGRLIVEQMLRSGMEPVVCGRAKPAVEALGRKLGLRARVASLDDPEGMFAAIRGCQVLVNAAGPFTGTALRLVDACLRAGAHYLDVSGEIDALESVAGRHREALAAKVMLLPGTGFDVVPSDCLALHVVRRLPNASRLTIAVSGLELMSRGSARTMATELARGVRVRRGGRIETVPAGALERGFDFGEGGRACTAVSWGDVATAHYTTGVPDVEVYFEATASVRSTLAASRGFGRLLGSGPWQTWIRTLAELVPEGPTEVERERRRAAVVAEAMAPDGARALARLRLPEAYTFTGLAAAAIAGRVLHGDVEPGFQTPGRLFGPDFVLGFPDVVRDDLDD